MPRKPADQTVQREDILLAAAAVFRERGYAGATMADIARRVRLTAGSLYHHFPEGKQDLLLAVLNTSMEAGLSQLEAVRAACLPPPEALRRMIAAHVVNLTKNVAIGAALVFEIRALIDLQAGTPSAAERDRFITQRDAFEGHFRQVIREGIAAGDFREVDVPIFTKAILGAQNWISVWYKPGGRLDGEAIAAHLAEIFLSALLP